MSSLPKITWDIDPVFLHVPRELVIGVAAAIAGFGLIQGLRRKGGDHYTTALLFGALTFVAWKFMGEGLELRYYSLLFVGVFLGGYSFLKWQIVRGGGPEQDAGDFIVYGVLGVLVGARLGHVLFYDLDKALADPAWIVKIWTGGLASHGAVLGLILAMWIFTKRRGIPFLEGADRFSFSAALGATLVRIGNLMNSEIVGREVPGQTWGFSFPRFDHKVPAPYRYPTQLAEIALGLAVLAGLFLIDKRLGKEKRPRGAMIASFFVIYFGGRFFIEFWKEYEGIEKGSPLTMGQILSLPAFLLGVSGLIWALKRRVPAGWPTLAFSENAKERRKRSAKATPVEEEDDDEDDDQKEPGDEESSDDETDADGPDSARDERDDDEDEEVEDDDEVSEKGSQGGKAPSHDPDVDSEFDEKGSLKRRRGPSDD